MALIELNFFSEALGMQTQALVIIPQRSALGQIGVANKAQDTAYKCLYLLHGLSDDQTIWLRRTAIERYAAEYGVCIVMPCGGRSFYCDIKNGMSYYTYIAKELPLRIREFLRVSHKREDNFIAGLSMGGYGALKIALREPDTFCAGAGLSPVANFREDGFDDIKLGIFGTVELPKNEDLFQLADMQKDHPNRPRLYIAIGTDDFLYSGTQLLRKKLTDNGYDLTYEEEKADHNWAFWDKKIQTVLAWMFDNER